MFAATPWAYAGADGVLLNLEGKDGKILAIDKAVKPATSAEDMAAKLGELRVAMKK